ncbi:MAG TPA: hypothetical protein VLR49_15970, partial [Ferruginibacter sp.]|nr:hypothetical protein [Ferruginibacter sp.]
MKVVAIKPVSRQFIHPHLLIDFKRSWLAVKWLVVFLFTGITVCFAQREPAGFYEQVDATMLIDSNAHLFISSIEVNGNK